MPTVWSEREPGAWQECTESAYLMGLVHGGFRAFPLGIYSDAERDALDAASPPDPAVGSTFPLVEAGSLNRYGVKLRTLTGSTTRATSAQLRAALLTPGLAVVMAGSFTNAQSLNRWQPGFNGGHAITVLTSGTRTVRFMDPLAPDGYGGDLVDIDQIMAFAWVPSDARVSRAGEFGTTAEEDDLQIRSPIVTQEWDTVPGAVAVRSDGTTTKFAGTTRVKSIAEGDFNGNDSRLIDYGTDHVPLVIDRRSLTNPGPRVVGSMTSGGFTQAQLDAKYWEGFNNAKAGIEELKAEVAKAIVSITTLTADVQTLNVRNANAKTAMLAAIAALQN